MKRATQEEREKMSDGANFILHLSAFDLSSGGEGE
jgi:hypothetical protein